MNKYRNVKTTLYGITFDSKREASRYADLRLLQQGGAISDLRTQVPYDLTVNGVKVCKYIADFVYMRGDEQVVEDSKGMKTAVYNLKKKLMKAVHGIVVEES